MIKTSAEYKLAASIAYNGIAKLANSNVSRNARLAGKVGLGVGGVLGAGLGAAGAGGFSGLDYLARAADAGDVQAISKIMPDPVMKLLNVNSPMGLDDFTKTMQELEKVNANDFLRKLVFTGMRENVPLTLGAAAGAGGLGGLTAGGLGYLSGAGATGAYNLIKGKPKSTGVMGVLRRALRR